MIWQPDKSRSQNLLVSSGTMDISDGSIEMLVIPMVLKFDRSHGIGLLNGVDVQALQPDDRLHMSL